MTGLEKAGALLALSYFLKARSSGPQAYKNGQPIDVTLVQIDDTGHLLETGAAADFARMREQAALDGVPMEVESAFRTMEQQTALWVAYQKGERTDVVAPPGYSNHQDGQAVDLVTARGTNATYRWLLEHAATFNFYATVSSEPWHWEHRT